MENNQPEKNCGNCANRDCVGSSNGGKFCHSYRPLYSKKPEPQGWEERFDKAFPHCGGAFKTSVMAFIRQVAVEEREKGRAQERQDVLSYLGWVEGGAEIYNAIEQNKHREGGK